MTPDEDAAEAEYIAAKAAYQAAIERLRLAKAARPRAALRATKRRYQLGYKQRRAAEDMRRGQEHTQAQRRAVVSVLGPFFKLPP